MNIDQYNLFGLNWYDWEFPVQSAHNCQETIPFSETSSAENHTKSQNWADTTRLRQTAINNVKILWFR